MDWVTLNKSKFNPEKTEVFLVSQKADQGVGMQPLMDRITLLLKKTAVQFGGAPGSIPGHAQVSTVARSAFPQLKLVCQLYMFLKWSDLAMMKHVILITSWITVTHCTWGFSWSKMLQPNY